MLTSLTHLNISNNELSGLINEIIIIFIIVFPTCLILYIEIDNIGLLKCLTHLNLSNNKISGTIIRDNIQLIRDIQ
jgi:Leucine-rich repeat (LRR) protein